MHSVTLSPKYMAPRFGRRTLISIGPGTQPAMGLETAFPRGFRVHQDDSNAGSAA